MSEVDSVVEDTSTPEAEEVLTDQPEAEDQTSEPDVDDVEEPEEAEGEESEQDDEQPDEDSSPDTVTVEIDGVEYDVAPGIKDSLMRTTDYTEKTQSLGEERRAYEAEKADFQQYMDATRAQSESMANLAALDQQLQSFQQYDWNAAFDADITSATKLQHQFQQLQSQREQLVGSIQHSELSRQAERHEQMVRTAERTDAELTKEIPNWGAERKSELGKFAVETLGFPSHMVSNAVTKSEIKTLHYAEIGYRMENKVKADAKAAGKKVTDIKPSKNIQPKRQKAPVRLSSVSDPEQYRQLRLAQKQRKKA